MGKYMYPIKINREPLEISYHHEIILEDGILSLVELKQHVSESEKFTIIEKEGNHFLGVTVLVVYGKRLETPEETQMRVKKEEEYMKGYDDFHNKNKEG